MRRENDLDQTQTGYEELWYHLTDAQFSTVAVMQESTKRDPRPVLLERISYDPYGKARHHHPEDMDGDGAVNASDLAVIINNFGNPGAGDVNRDGIVSTTDLGLVQNNYEAGLAPGKLSLTDNQIGYAGYLFNAETAEYAAYLARNRSYDPHLGRWIERDPAGYVDGGNLYGYVSNQPTVHLDPSGLWKIKRDLKRKAVATAERFDSIRSLANQISLNASEYLKWLTVDGGIDMANGKGYRLYDINVNSRVCPGEKVRIPNHVQIDFASNVTPNEKEFPKIFFFWRISAVDAYQYWFSLGYSVDYDRSATRGDILSHLENGTSNKELFKYYYFGHGANRSISVGNGINSDRYTAYGINYMQLYACECLMPSDGRSPLGMPHDEGNVGWRRNVSSPGYLVGFRDSPSTANRWYTWTSILHGVDEGP